MATRFEKTLYAASAFLGLGVSFASVKASTYYPSYFDASFKTDAVPAIGDPVPVDQLWLASEAPEWTDFQRNYIAPDGRVIDTGNGGISHSEGQGYGMLFAVAFDDRPAFDRIFAWTELHLKRPDDALHSWKYDPSSSELVPDPNNATDGDIFIAAALARAARRWQDRRYAIASDAISRAILTLLVVKVDEYTVLLPGVDGFERRNAVVINPSYYPAAIMHDLAGLTPSPLWDELHASSNAIILQAAFGAWGLPADWLEISRLDGSIVLAPGWPARFSFDAIRIPLYLAWSGDLTSGERENLEGFWQARSAQPAWVDLQTGRLAPYAASSGMRAVAILASATVGPFPIVLPHVREALDYYSASLTMLTHIAAHERARAGSQLVPPNNLTVAGSPHHENRQVIASASTPG